MGPLLNDIALFVEVAKARNFSRAAEWLDMPVSTLSRRIRLLEGDIGVPLLKRSTRKVELTEAGSVYFERSQHIIDAAHIAHEQLLDAAQQPKGRLRVSMPSSFALMCMPVILQEFSKQYPEIECEFDLSIRPVDLMADPFDLVIRFGRQPDSGVISRQISTVSLGLYAAPGYLAQHGTPQSPAELSGHQCLRSSASKEDSIWELHSGERVEKVAIIGRLAMNNVGMLRRVAEQGLGIVPLSIRIGSAAAESERLQRILPEWEFKPIPLLALFPSRLMPAKTRVFIDFLQERLQMSCK